MMWGKSKDAFNRVVEVVREAEASGNGTLPEDVARAYEATWNARRYELIGSREWLKAAQWWRIVANNAEERGEEGSPLHRGARAASDALYEVVRERKAFTAPNRTREGEQRK